MPTTTLRVRYRPLRIGMLIEEGSLQQLASAARLNCVIWGGAYNPVIPVPAGNSHIERVARLFRLDTLYPIEDRPGIQAAQTRCDWLDWKHFAYPRPEPTSGHEALLKTVVDVRPIFERHSGGGTVPEATSNYLLPVWSNDDSLASLFTVLFGGYPETSVHQFASDYQKRLGAFRAEISTLDEVPVPWTKKASPVQITRDGLKADVHRKRDVGVLYGDPNSFLDLAMFWNLRACGARVLFLPSVDGGRMHGFLAAILPEFQATIADRGDLGRSLVVWTRDIDAATKAVQGLVPNASLVFSTFSSAFDATDTGGAPVFRFDEHTVLADVEQEETERSRVTFQCPRKPLPENPDRSIYGQHWVVSVRPMGEYRRDAMTLQPPFIPELNERYRRLFSFGSSAVRSEHEGLGFVANATDATHTLTHASADQIFEAMFELAGFTVSQSRAGSLAARLVRQCGGLDGCRVFKIPGVRKMLGRPEARAAGLTWSDATRTVFDKDGSNPASFLEHQGLFIEARKQKHLKPDDVVRFLLKKELLRAGLSLVCPHCELDQWISLTEVSESRRCQFCGKTYPLSLQLKDRGDWRFRLSGILGRDEGDQGSVSVALAALQILRKHTGSETFLWMPGVLLEKGGRTCEADFVALEKDWTGATSLLLAECKGGNEIDQNDIDNLLAAKQELEPLGINCFLLFSKSEVDFTKAEIERFTQLVTAGHRIILFTKKNLEPYGPYDHADAKKLTKAYGSTFDDMATNSVQMYLQPTPV